MARFKSVVRHSSYLLGSKLLSRLLFTLFSLYAAVRLGPGLYGALAFTLAVVELTNSFGDLGITRYGTRELVRNMDDGSTIAGKVMALQVSTSAIFSLTGLVVLLAFHPASPKYQLLLIGLGAVIVSGAISATESVLIASENFFLSATASLLGRLIFVGVGFVAIRAGVSVVYVMWGFLAGLFIEAVLRITWVRKKIMRFSFGFQPGALWRMLMASVPFALGATASIVLMQVGMVMLGFLEDDATVGVYGVAFALYIPFMWAPIILAKTIFPGLTGMYARDRNAARMNGWQWYRLMAMTGIPIAALVTILAEPVLAYFPSTYRESADILIVMVWSLPPMIMAAIEINIMQITNRERDSARILVTTAIIAIALNIILIPYFGAMGAAIALLAGSILREVQMYFDVYKHFMRKHMVTSFIRPALGGLAMLAVALGVGQVNIWAAAAAALATYVIIIFATGGVRVNELRTLLGSR